MARVEAMLVWWQADMCTLKSLQLPRVCACLSQYTFKTTEIDVKNMKASDISDCFRHVIGGETKHHLVQKISVEFSFK